MVGIAVALLQHTAEPHNPVWESIRGAMEGGASMWVLSTAARALPEPLPMGSRWYLFFYKFTQLLMANWDKRQPPAEK